MALIAESHEAKWIRPGIPDYSNSRQGKLRVGRLLRVQPTPAYQASCRCGVHNLTVFGRDLQRNIARCPTCGVEPIPTASADVHAAERLERYKASLQARAEVEAAERAAQKEAEVREREERESRVRAEELPKLQDKFARLHNDLAIAQRNALLNRPDSELFVSPVVVALGLKGEDAEQWNREQEQAFVSLPEYAAYKNRETMAALEQYFAANGVQVADIQMLRSAFNRLLAFGLIHPNAAPETTPQATTQVSEADEPVDPVTTSKRNGPRIHTGISLVDGREREYTDFEVARMSADDFRRVFAIPTHEESE